MAAVNAHRENCLVMTGRFDPNGALESHRTEGRIFHCSMAKNYNVHERTFQSVREFQQQIEEVSRNQGKPAVLVIKAHGTANSFACTDVEDYVAPDPRTYEHLQPGAPILLASCNTGQKLADRMHSILRRSVMAPTEAIPIKHAFFFHYRGRPVLLHYNFDGELVTRSLPRDVSPPELEREMIASFQRRASIGDPHAKLQLVKCLLKGIGVAKNPRKAASLLKQIAYTLPEAASYLGHYYVSGMPGLPKDLRKAREFLTIAANAGITDAEFTLSEIAHDPREQIERLEICVHDGSLQATLKLAKILKDIDPVKSFTYFALAMRRGSALAAYEIGQALIEGRGEQQNIPLGMKYLQKAAGLGFAKAAAALGALYKEANDMQNAKKWFRVAAQNNFPSANYMMGRLSNTFADKIYWYNKEEAFEARAMVQLGKLYKYNDANRDLEQSLLYFTWAAEEGNVEADFHLGLAHLEGAGTPQNLQKAEEHFRRCVKQFPDGLFKLAEVFLQRGNIEGALPYLREAAHRGVSQAMLKLSQFLAPKEAQLWLERAADGGNIEAMIRFGKLLATRDPVRSIHYLEKAYEAGDRRGAGQLAYFYLEGIGVPRDVAKAKIFLQDS